MKPAKKKYVEPDRSSKRYKVLKGMERAVRDTKRGKDFRLDLASNQDNNLEILVSDLVICVNRRNGEFDPLLNAVECLDAIYLYVIRSSPLLLNSGLLQGLVDGRDALHERVVRKRPSLLFDRLKEMDGRFRWMESIEESIAWKSAHSNCDDDGDDEEGDRPVRNARDMLEALIMLALHALVVGHNKGARTVMAQMLEEAGLHDMNGKTRNPLKIEQVDRWMRSVKYRKRAAFGRNYCWNELLTQCRSQLLACKDPVVSRKFARDLLETARCSQPENFMPFRVRD